MDIIAAFRAVSANGATKIAAHLSIEIGGRIGWRNVSAYPI
jgi:hypothetical protein